MSLSKHKFYAIPTQDPAFQGLQKQWYAVLKSEGFEDVESTEYADPPLKRWSGISSVYVTKFQPPLVAIISSFPESVYKEEEHFQSNPEFEYLCNTIGRRCSGAGRPSVMTPAVIRGIWIDYCNGGTTRAAELKYGVSDTTAFRVIHAVTEWMNLMDTRAEAETETSPTTIIVRGYHHTMDSPIVYATWRHALWYDHTREESYSDEFYSATTKSIKKVLADPYTTVKVACAKEDPNFIAGYAVMNRDNLIWVYVKIDYRKKGIASLMSKGFKTVSEPATKIGKAIVESRKLTIKENHDGTEEDYPKEPLPA